MKERERIAKWLFRQLSDAIQFLHCKKSIVHRDIKLDNILYSSFDRKLKLTDFTVAKEFSADDRIFESEGTPEFSAPETNDISNEDGHLPKPLDMWSIGVCYFTYVTGVLPFFETPERDHNIETYKEELEGLSEGLRGMLKKLLIKDPSMRCTIEELVEWFSKEG